MSWTEHLKTKGAALGWARAGQAPPLQGWSGFADFADDFAGGGFVGWHDQETEAAWLCAFTADADPVFA